MKTLKDTFEIIAWMIAGILFAMGIMFLSALVRCI